MRRTIGAILGGGPGSRLYPLTKYRSKPAVPFAGKYRLIDIPISNCLNSGLDRIFVLTQYNSASLNRHIALAYKFDALHEGFVSVLAAEQAPDHSDWYQGSADALRMNLRHFNPYRPRDIFILRGDHIYRMDYRVMVSHHRQQRADVTIACLPVQAQEAHRFNILRMNSEGRIVDNRASPQKLDDLSDWALAPGLFGGEIRVGKEPVYLASMGIYLCRYEILKEVLAKQSGAHLEDEIIPYAIGNLRTFGFPFLGYWRDIDSIRAYFDANLLLTEPKPPFDLFDPQMRIFTHPRFLPGSLLGEIQLQGTIVCDGCRVEKARLNRCVVGVRCVLRGEVELEDTVLIGADYYETEEEIRENREVGRPDVGIGSDTKIRRAIVDKNARIGYGVRIDPPENAADRQEEGWVIQDGIVIVEKDAVIADGSVLP
ncbi:MAG: glucose-1-phosphate adenylyltransferase [Calditrichaeota bacterium]|nr:glucose-1-phosphate adenylyltransferase [Calditrichota bacterium]